MASTQRIARMIATECACLQLRSAARVTTRVYDAELRAVGLRISQLTVLVAVAMFGEGGAAMKPLAAAIAMDRTTLTRSLKPLVDDGHLVLAADPEDRRSRRVQLTAAGAKALETAYPLWKRAQARMRKDVGAASLDALGPALAEIHSALAATAGDDD